MTRVIFTSLTALLLSGTAFAGPSGTGGFAAVALAGVIAPYSPTLPAHDKAVMARIFDGQDPAGNKFTVTADSVSCEAGDVSINRFKCYLTFGKATLTLTGREASEIYATLIEAGVPGRGGAGTIFESLTLLSCTIDPQAIGQNNGGGASCSFTTSL